MRVYRRLLSLLLIMVLMAAMLGTAVVAWEADPVDPAAELMVYIRNAGVDTLVHTYSQADLWALTKGRNVLYSGIDNMPATVRTEASGVYLNDFLDDVQKYTTYDVWACESFRVRCTDNATEKYTLDDLVHTTRYYYPDIHTDAGGINEDSEINCPLGIGIAVTTMLAIDGMQHRLPVPGGEGRNTPLSMCTLIFGMTEQEGTDAVRRVSSYKRGIGTFIIDMGNAADPNGGTSGGTNGGTVAITAVSLDRTTLTIAEGKSFQLTAIIEPENAQDTSVTWASGDTSVVTVSATGVVTGIKKGTAAVTVRSVADDNLSAKCTVTVVEKEIEPTSISLSKSKLTLLPGGESRIDAVVFPHDATFTGIVWTSNDSKIATVDADGKIKGAELGTAIITATIIDTKISAACTVTVTDEIVAPVGIGLNRSILRMKPGESYQMRLTVEPDHANSYTTLWGSSAQGVVSVDTNGKLTAINTGVAVITVLIDEFELQASCTVTVANEKISFSDSNSHWAGASITTMAEHGFITGYDDGTFKPEAKISRAEFATILIRILQEVKGVAITDENTFTDTDGHWAQANISTAVKLKLLSGYGDGRFGPDSAITREQIAVMLFNATGAESSLNTDFADSGNISPWATEAVTAAANLGWIKGYEDNSFRPLKNATRAEACTVLLRFYEYIEQQ